MPSPNKQSFASLRDKILSQNGKQYWRSLEEHADTEEFRNLVAQEYPHEIEQWDNSLSRRNFVKVMGASLALAGLSGCVYQPPEKIVPYVNDPEGMLPGRPNFFATAMTLGGMAMGLLAKSYDGRPVKLEGNPDHPNSRGATDARAQAELLSMYDPDRSQEVTFRGNATNYDSFVTAIRGAIEQNRADGGAGIRFLTETVTSPTLIDQFARLSRELPNARWVQYEPVNNDNAMIGARMAFGAPVNTVYKFDRAARILSLDADIFSSFNVGYMKDYVAAKAYHHGKEPNRLYTVETTMSLMGAKSDHRLAVKPSEMVEVAKAIAAALGVAGASSRYTANADWISAMARDLMAHRGSSVVIAGEHQPPIVHALAHAINGALGNAGQTVVYTEPLTAFADRPQIDQLRELISDIDAGRVRMLVILGGNPVYNTPIDLKLSPERMSHVPLRVHLGQYVDETAEHCHWHVSQKHFLEGWSDARAYDGTVSITQPLIKPLYDSKNAHEIVQLFFTENFDRKDYDIVRDFWQSQNISAAAVPSATPSAAGVVQGGGQSHTTGSPAPQPQGTPAPSPSPAQRPAATPAAGRATAPAPSSGARAGTRGTEGAAATGAGAANTQPGGAATNGGAAAAAPAFEDNWRRAVHDGIVPNTTAAPRTVAVNPAFLTQPEPNTAPTGGGLEISIRPDPCIYDGRYANNGWLQELPKPLNKVTWENVALVSPATARRLGVNTGTEDGRDYAGAPQGTSFINTYGGNNFSDLVTLKYQGSEISKPVPLWIQPGQPDDVITIFLGYGRTRAGRIGTGIGYNAYEVRRSDALHHGFGEIAKTGATTTVTSTQIHFNMEGRDLIRVFEFEEFEKNPEMGHQHDEYPKSMYPYEQHQAVYEQNYRWGMTVDLNSCIGCNACVVACQAENNIPVVGKEQVNRSREMHWLRIDAYYGGGTVDRPEGPHFQPVLCMQCEQAPCEVVCPVHATVHSAEGLNDMVYNRCVGTRYCSNNCPYKVRRFNFLLYQDWNTPQYKLMRNPEVTVRSRGVMEKCTYCTQRISIARIEAEKDGRRIQDGEVVTACQAACPTNVFTFGDLNDPNSAVSKAAHDHRNYKLLNELNTQPRTTYMAEMRNQNKEMPDYVPPVTKPRAKVDTRPGTGPDGGEAH